MEEDIQKRLRGHVAVNIEDTPTDMQTSATEAAQLETIVKKRVECAFQFLCTPMTMIIPSTG